MGRRRRFISKRGGGSKSSRASGGPKKRRLAMGQLSTFEYLLKKALEDVEMGGTIFGNIYSKAANVGTEEAKQYVESIADDESIERAKADEIIGLLNRYSKMR